jgi:hypothetical protein
MREYAFDVKLWAVARVSANSNEKSPAVTRGSRRNRPSILVQAEMRGEPHRPSTWVRVLSSF